MWRGVPSAIDRTAFAWEGPDGSSVRTVYMATSYSNGAGLPTDADDLARRTTKIRRDLEPFSPGADLLVMCGTDHLFPTPGLPKALEAASENGLRYRVSSLTDYIAASRAAQADGLPVWKGELRSGARANLLMGVVSNRVDLRRLVARAERELERYAEPLQALAAPHLAPGLLDIAWRKLIENSAHDTVCACSHDEVTAQGKVRWLEALQIAEGISERALRHLARSVSAPPGPSLVVWNPSPRARTVVVEADLEVPAEWGSLVAVDVATGERGAVEELSKAEPVALHLDLPMPMVVQAMEMIQGRQVGEEWVNAIEVPLISDERIEAVFRVDSVPRGFIDVEAEVARMRQIAEDHAQAMVSLTALRPSRRRLLIEVPDVPGLGWTTVRLEEGTAESTLATPVSPDASLLPRVVDGGDVGDTYNYCWPDDDVFVDSMEILGDEIVEDGRLRKVRRVTTRHETIGDIDWTLASVAGAGSVSISMEWVNQREDHRVRLHLPLPGKTTESYAGGPFSIDRRGLDAEGGPSEVGLPTFPARDTLSAGGLFLVLPQVTEYEIVGDGTEVALTALRCTGVISQGPMATRPMPAGPAIPTPAAQCPGPQSFSYTLVVDADREAAIDAVLAPPRAVAVHRDSDGSLASRRSGPTIHGRLRLSSCRRLPTGELEVRLWNPSGQTAGGGVEGGTKVDLLGRPLRSSPGGLRGHEIATYRITT